MLLTGLMSRFRNAISSSPDSRQRRRKTSEVGHNVNVESLEARLLLTEAGGVTIGDFVWNDLNRDGIQDPGEPGIPDVTVNLLDRFGGGPLDTTLTDANGEYCFADVESEAFIVEFVLPPGFAFTQQNAGSDDTKDSDANPSDGWAPVDVTGGNSDLTIDAGMVQASIGNVVFNDANNNGAQDGGEAGIPGVVVFLDTNGNGNPDAGELNQTTDGNGNYDFTGLSSGTYAVTVLASSVPSGLSATTANPMSVAVGVGEDFNDADFGFRSSSTRITGRKWHDLNADGIRDSGEPGAQRCDHPSAGCEW